MNICKEDFSFDEASCQLSNSQILGEFELAENATLHFYAEMNGLAGYADGVELSIEFTNPADGSGVKIVFDGMFSAQGHIWLLEHGISIKHLLTTSRPEEYVRECISSVLKERVKLEISRDGQDVIFDLDLAGFNTEAKYPYNKKLQKVLKERSESIPAI